ncbi:MAG: 1-deoxy-D-xylulose-5-phosphate synthase [Lachnospiraceae bacterium]|nr:1-deoxy-D-xylulose-5-phosphate synthase [Lachnospiraceae bacterium]
MILDSINDPGDIKKISPSDYPELCKEIREFLIEKVSVTGGHLASNLGVVELTIALHLALDLPHDKIVWDVGHQTYVHKILTGRKEGFDTLRQFRGMSGFPKKAESEYDVFDSGHSSDSLSVGLGLANARDIVKDDYQVVSVIGDGALTGGLALEAINNISEYKGKFIAIVNDNKMSISANKGFVSGFLNNIRMASPYIELKNDVESGLERMKSGEKWIGRLRKTKDSIKHMVMPTTLFDELGIKYLGPIDGHNIDKLVKAINAAKRSKKPVILHVVTTKGKGYTFAEKRPEKYHGVGPFNVQTGRTKAANQITYTRIFSNKLCNMAYDNDKIVAITASMSEGTGLLEFGKKFPDRYFDVGIAEEHAVSFAAGLASGGLIPVVAIYSSFLQRAFDEILHDVCLQGLHVIFAIDRAGIVGSDGQTHQGIFDISYMNIIPGVTIIAPRNRYELESAIEYAVNNKGVYAIRYPRGGVNLDYEDSIQEFLPSKSEVICEGDDIAIVSVGNMISEARVVYDKLYSDGVRPMLINARFLYPFDDELFTHLSTYYRKIFVLEENVHTGGFGMRLKDRYGDKVYSFSLPDTYVEHGSRALLLKEYGLDGESIYAKIKENI